MTVDHIFKLTPIWVIGHTNKKYRTNQSPWVFMWFISFASVPNFNLQSGQGCSCCCLLDFFTGEGDGSSLAAVSNAPYNIAISVYNIMFSTCWWILLFFLGWALVGVSGCCWCARPCRRCLLGGCRCACPRRRRCLLCLKYPSFSQFIVNIKFLLHLQWTPQCSTNFTQFYLSNNFNSSSWLLWFPLVVEFCLKVLASYNSWRKHCLGFDHCLSFRILHDLYLSRILCRLVKVFNP